MNNRIKRFASAFLAISLVVGLLIPALGGASIAQAEPANPLQKTVEAMEPGWNLGNTFEASGDETSWGNPTVTKEQIQAIKDQGYRTIRIPVTWNHRLGEGPNYEIQPEFLSRIHEVVDWSLDSGLTVILNIHHDSHWMMNMENERDTVMIKYTALWKQIATSFKDYPHTLFFEAVNEPRFSEDWNEDRPVYFEMVDQLNSTFHKIVRESGGNNKTRPLVMEGVTASHSQARLDELYKTITKLNDPNVIATIHYYGLYTFSVNAAGATTFDDAAKKDITDTFDRTYETFVARGIPVIIGEFGLLGFDKSVETLEYGEILKYFEYVTHYAHEKKMPTILWDNGQHFDRTNLTWKNPAFHEVMKASLNGRSSNSQSDSIYLRQGDELQDVTIPMNLNGNTLKEIKAGDRVLAAGTDYVLDGEQLTLKKELLRSLLTDQLGTNATLALTFSYGAGWNVHLIQYTTATTRNVEGGSRDLFIIPVKFNGDRLEKIEATYAAGGNAGPDSWTPFLEFGKSFQPEYENNLITLTKPFLEQLKDGDVQFKLYFWSGATLEYKMTVAGDLINGFSPEMEAAATASPAATATASPTDAASPTVQPDSTDKEEGNQALIYWISGAVLALIVLSAGVVLYRKKNRK
ncbi:cellulase family glycosylhydrolase [Gorillibacterium sp. CAU 1737]|uniref:cellulase family glycosylhydrolase n=1 Tax=Gorillibacterium sp. CAU 1737 TaxID=3140362 RepID=UPI003260279E